MEGDIDGELEGEDVKGEIDGTVVGELELGEIDGTFVGMRVGSPRSQAEIAIVKLNVAGNANLNGRSITISLLNSPKCLSMYVSLYLKSSKKYAIPSLTCKESFKSSYWKRCQSVSKQNMFVLSCHPPVNPRSSSKRKFVSRSEKSIRLS